MCMTHFSSQQINYKKYCVFHETDPQSSVKMAEAADTENNAMSKLRPDWVNSSVYISFINNNGEVTHRHCPFSSVNGNAVLLFSEFVIVPSVRPAPIKSFLEYPMHMPKCHTCICIIEGPPLRPLYRSLSLWRNRHGPHKRFVLLHFSNTARESGPASGFHWEKIPPRWCCFLSGDLSHRKGISNRFAI